MKAIITALFLLAMQSAAAQPQTFSEAELAAVVRSFHPVAKQAALGVQIAKADITARRGAFDPEWRAETGRKEFDGLTYYDQRVNEVRIPTWYGIDLYAGQETINGQRLNPEATKGSLSYLGFTVPVLQNLLMDKRRAALLQARNFQQLSEVEQQAMLNDLVRDALQTYWEWWEQYHLDRLLKASLQNAEQRLGMVKTAVALGDRPAIDTVEALTQVQSIQIKLFEVQAALLKARFALSAFLWTENGGQWDLPDAVAPQDIPAPAAFMLAELLQSASNHPELRQYQFKLRNLEVEKRLKFQSLLPELKIKYNQTGYDFSKTVNAAWFNNNYRYGLSFSLPLRLSEGRGEYRKARLKIESTTLEQANKQVQLYNKVKQYFADWQQTSAQLSVQENMVGNVVALQRGEETRFANGESSLFLVNARELRTIEAQQKFIELRAKVQKAGIGLRWAAGLLAQ